MIQKPIYWLFAVAFMGCVTGFALSIAGSHLERVQLFEAGRIVMVASFGVGMLPTLAVLVIRLWDYFRRGGI